MTKIDDLHCESKTIVELREEIGTLKSAITEL